MTRREIGVSDAIKRELVEMNKRYPNSKLDKTGALAYYDDLTDLPEDSVVNAIRACRKSSKFLPTVAEIREVAVDIMGDAQGFWVTPEAAWREALDKAWLFGLREKREVYTWDDDDNIVGVEVEPLTWSSPVVERAVSIIGWREICMMELGGKEERTMFAQFRDTVKAEQGRVKQSLISGRAMEEGRIALPEPNQGMTAMGDVIAGMIEARANTARGETSSE